MGNGNVASVIVLPVFNCRRREKVKVKSGIFITETQRHKVSAYCTTLCLSASVLKKLNTNHQQFDSDDDK